MTQPILQYPAASGSGPIVYDAYQKWSGIALDSYGKAQEMASHIADFPISPVAFNASFDPQIALAPFPTIAKPQLTGDLTFHAPPSPPEPPTITVPVMPSLEYVSALLDGVKNALGAALGGNAMPPALAEALRQRAYSEAFTEEGRAVEQAYSEFASRGFEEPAGQLNRRITEARNDARAKRQLINRDVYIQEQTVIIENLRFAVTSGIQLEGMNVQVFRAKADVQLEEVRILSETDRLMIDAWTAKITQYDTELRGEMARLDAVTREFEANVNVYRADAQVATAAGDYDNRRFQLNLAQEQAIVDTEMKRAEQNFEQMRYITSVMLEIKKTLAQVGTQLAAAAMSAVNIGASMSSGTSESVGYSLGVSYSGSMTP